MKRTVNMPDTEPDKTARELPSEKEHLFQVVNIFTSEDEIGQKLNLDDDTVSVECEVVGGAEEGRTLLCRLGLDIEWKGFFATRIFLKNIREEYKGKKVDIDTDNWIGKQFYATVIHNGKYANLDTYSEEKNLALKDNKETWAGEEESPL